ncbi:MAG: NAD(P)/FAD-dependent oxidoreductase [Sphingobium sp.]
MSAFPRRRFLTGAGAVGLSLALPGVARAASRARVVIIGGGFGGLSVARALRRHDPGLHITLIERDRRFVTCPMSNGVLGGLWPISDISFTYDKVAAAGITVRHDSASAIDPVGRKVTLAGGGTIPYDYLVVSPGIQIMWDAIEGYDRKAAEIMPHAWIAGAQTVLLRKQLEAMEDGGLVVIGVPPTPYKCPPGPYERVSLIAHYLKRHKPRSKILVLDAKDSFSKQGLFMEAWNNLYPGMVEWVPGSQSGKVMRVDPATMTVSTGFDDHKAAVANIIPPQRAAEIAIAAGLDQGVGYCAIDPVTFESRAHKGVYVLGDAAIAGAMPKSAFSANVQAKACALAILCDMAGKAPPSPRMLNVCYSLASPDYGFSIAESFDVQGGAIHLMFEDGRTTPLKAAADVHQKEAAYARSWYATITAEIFG